MTVVRWVLVLVVFIGMGALIIALDTNATEHRKNAPCSEWVSARIADVPARCITEWGATEREKHPRTRYGDIAAMSAYGD